MVWKINMYAEMIEKIAKQNGQFLLFLKKWKSLKIFCKNLCNKVSKMKNMRWLFSSFFCADCNGILCFFGRWILQGGNPETKSPVLTFFKNIEKWRKVWCNKWLKKWKMLFLLHSSSRAVQADRFATPNFLWRPPESHLITCMTCLI